MQKADFFPLFFFVVGGGEKCGEISPSLSKEKQKVKKGEIKKEKEKKILFYLEKV